jgi:hypothetical protein
MADLWEVNCAEKEVDGVGRGVRRDMLIGSGQHCQRVGA